MTGPRPHLGAWPLATLVFCASIGPLTFGLDGFVLATAGRAVAGWAVLGLLVAPFLAWWTSRFGVPTVGNGATGSLWALAAAIFFLTGAGLDLHRWLEVLRVSEYPNTPSWALALATLSAVAYAVRMGPENLQRLAVPLAGLVALTVGGVLACSWGLGHGGRLLGGSAPLFGDSGLPAAWPLLLFAAQGSALSAVFVRYTDRTLYRRPVILAVCSATLLVAVAYVLPIVVWNLGPALHAEFPLLHAITPVATIFFPVHRLALVAFAPLQVSVIVQLSAFLLATLDLLGWRTFPLAWGPAVLASCAAVAIMAVWPAPSFTIASLAALWSLAGLGLLAALPLAQVAQVARKGARPST